MAAILNIEKTLATFTYKLSRYFLTSFESVCLSVQERCKIDFQDGGCGDHLEFPIGITLAIFSRWQPSTTSDE